jgi:hypothetical protein
MIEKLLCLLAVLSLSLHAADVCNPNDLRGPFGFQLSGATTISGESQPVSSLGRIVLDGQGGISGNSSVMIAGYLLGNPVTGTYEARSNCSVSWSLQDDSGASQHFSGVVSRDGKRAQFRQTDLGAAQNGIMVRTADGCRVSDLKMGYDFTLSGSFTPMTPGELPATVDAKGQIRAVRNGVFVLTRRGTRSDATEVKLEVESDCSMHLQLTLPEDGGGVALPMNLQGILADGAQEILAIQTDPGWMVSAKFVAHPAGGVRP